MNPLDSTPRNSRRGTAVGRSLAGATACLALVAGGCRDASPPPRTTTALTSRPPAPIIFEREASAAGSRVLVVGVDGADWKVIGPLIEAGELPAFARLLRDGAHTSAFDVVSPHSPIAWTSVATSRAPKDHGITDYVTQLPNGNLIPITGSLRKVPALWEVADRHGLTTGLVGWWASWPADPIRGWVITDHANPAFSSFHFKDGRYWTEDPEELSKLGRDFHPLDIVETVQRRWVDLEDYPLEEIERSARFTPAQSKLLRSTPFHERETYSLLKTAHSVDWPLSRLAVDLMTSRPADLTMVYFRGPDPVQHYAWDLVEPERYEVPPENLERDRGLVEGVYRYVDGFLEDVLAAAGPDTWVLVVSDHGSEPNPAATGNPRRGRPGGHTKAAKGVMFVAGPHVRVGHVLAEASPYDVAPTAAWLLGMAISDEVEGRILTEAFADEFVASRPVQRVPSWGARDVQPAQASEADEAMMENLRALGYVQ